MKKGDWFIDKKTLCEKLCIVTTYFSEHFLNDLFMKSCEYRKSEKIWERYYNGNIRIKKLGQESRLNLLSTV